MQSKRSETFKIIEDFMDEWAWEYGTNPTQKTISEATGLSLSTVNRYLNELKKESGLASIRVNRSRDEISRLYEYSKAAVLYSDIACGVPKYAEENIAEFVKLPVSLFGSGDFFILNASGNSMINAGIEDGDMVLIKRQDYADPGDIVVALIEDEATLKRFYRDDENRRVILHPENDYMEDIYVKQCIIQGVAVFVFKKLRR
ncbi:MAG: repressor LexA [Oscillospiraceae bacterium]|nr:repressor LexA [Oscillospiraceae bacterium]